MRFSTIIAAVFIAITVAWLPQTAPAEEVYRWVDENGVVHFGDRAPEKGEAEKIAVQPGSGTPSPAAANPESPFAEPAQPTYAQQRRDARQVLKQEDAAEAEITADICKQAREVVTQLEPSPRVNVTHEDGTVTRMDDNARLEKLAEAKAFVSESCDKFP